MADMNNSQCNTSSLCLAVFTLLTATTVTAADAYPTKPGRLILPSGAGSSSDIMGRLFSQRFSEAWGQPLVVDNRAGAAGIIGTELAARAAPDGYTIFNYGIGQSIAPALHKNLPYQHLRDFTLISTFAMTPNLLTVTPSLGITTVQAFISAAKGQARPFKYASNGMGGTPHLTMELFKVATGIDVVHVPYKNSSQGFTDVAGGQMQTCFFTLPGLLPFVKSGRMRALAVSSARRAEQLPAVPTVIESGVPDFDVTVWQGFAVPRGTPQNHVAKIYAAMMKALETPELKQRFLENGVAAVPMTPVEFTRFVNVETAKWQRAVTVSGLKSE
jgi:tripartite-type tricarboxylate transporter receptor subunit TctC